tara:strand:+ start:465 stop:761 length:297 start_codon:yes stop_codon:yes gene_type:complete
MAKRKTPKGEKIVDLKPKADKITEEQLKSLQGLVKAINTAQADVGAIEARKHNLLHQVFEIQGMLAKLQEEFKEQYGTGDINIQDGSIRKQEDEQADS